MSAEEAYETAIEEVTAMLDDPSLATPDAPADVDWFTHEVVAYFKLYDHHDIWRESGARRLGEWLKVRRATPDAPADVGDIRQHAIDYLQSERDPAMTPDAPADGLDEQEVRRVIVEWLGPQRMSLYLNKDIDRMVIGAIAYTAARAATPPTEGTAG